LAMYIKELAKRAGAEFSFSPVAAGGRLTIYANWSARIGQATNFSLEESYNLMDDNYTLRVQGRVQNELWGYGNGGGQADRPLAVFRDDASIGTYGLRQGTRSYSELNDAGSVLNHIRSEINKTKDPKNTFKIAALDVGATYDNIRVGNSYPLRLWSIGFGIKANVRAVGIHIDPFRGRVELMTNEVTNDSTG